MDAPRILWSYLDQLKRIRLLARIPIAAAVGVMLTFGEAWLFDELPPAMVARIPSFIVTLLNSQVSFTVTTSLPYSLCLPTMYRYSKWGKRLSVITSVLL